MVGQGTGPSRRSHTKSRKGCKTCKRRHIRCDETFPQCRNCTKHQVRCDYMETVGSDSEGRQSPEQPSLVFTPGTESRIDQWQQTGSFPYPALQVFPLPQTNEYSKTELRLMHHLSTISDELMSRGTSNFTLWAQKVPTFLSIASSYPYVMHALLSFSANNLAWSQSSDDIRNLHIQHGTIALRGLHEAIGAFSHTNADAVLAASLLLLWQATDWRSWSSLRAGIQSVLSAMNSWKHESMFAEYINDEDLAAPTSHPSMQATTVSTSDRMTILSNTVQALDQLQQSLSAHEAESYWVGQLLSYMQRLQASSPASNPDEQLSHLYLLRKWLFWVPTLLLQRQGSQEPAMLTLAHFYATALALEPLYPDLGSVFCARIALAPLEAIINVASAMHSRISDQNSVEIATLMNFPRHTAIAYRSRRPESHHVGLDKTSPHLQHLNPDMFDYTTVGNMSPAFAPSPLHPAASQTPVLPSPYLGVPSSQAAGFALGAQPWGVLPSPGFPPQAYTEHDQAYGYAMGGFRSGAHDKAAGEGFSGYG